MTTLLSLLLLLPLFAAALALPLARRGAAALVLAFLAGGANLILCALVFARGLSCELPIELHGFVFSFDSARSAPFLLLAGAAFLPASLCAAAHFRARGGGRAFLALMYASLSMVNGALLANHLGLLLLFWEGLLCALFGLLLLGNVENPRALRRGFALAATSDLILMLGVAATAHAAQAALLGDMADLPAQGIGALGAICLLVGGLCKAGGVPFHSWLPEAVEDAPAPFAAVFPAALYAPLGGYLALRAIEIYAIPAGSPIATLLVVLGLASLLAGALLALRQEHLRRAIACVGIAQAGLIALGLGAAGAPGAAGTAGAALQVGVSALGVSGLQVAALAVQRASGSAQTRQAWPLWRALPVEAACAILLAGALAGVPPLAGFFSLAATLHAMGPLPALLLLLGQALLALALLRIVRRAFFAPRARAQERAASVPATLRVAVALATLASLLLAALRAPWLMRLGLSGTAGMAEGLALCAALALAGGLEALSARGKPRAGWRRAGAALEAGGALDPHRWLLALMDLLARAAQKTEDGVSWFWDVGVPTAARRAGDGLSRFDNGSLPRYLTLAVAGLLAIGVIFMIALL